MLDLTSDTVAAAAPAVIAGQPQGSAAAPTPHADALEVARLDTAYQAAVKRNDWMTMDRILHDDFVLVLGTGAVVSRSELIDEARSGAYTFEQQDEDPGTQTVRVWGDTAVVTARLWIKGSANGSAFDRRLWFSDTYVRTPGGWRYAFGQASIRLPSD